MFISTSISIFIHCKHLKQAFNVPIEFIIMTCALEELDEEFSNWIFATTWNGSTKYAGAPNWKTRTGLVPSTTTFSHGGIVLFQSILLKNNHFCLYNSNVLLFLLSQYEEICISQNLSISFNSFSVVGHFMSLGLKKVVIAPETSWL